MIEIDGVRGPGLHRGKQVYLEGRPLYETEYSDRLLERLLEANNPEKYRRHSEVTNLLAIDPDKTHHATARCFGPTPDQAGAGYRRPEGRRRRSSSRRESRWWWTRLAKRFKLISQARSISRPSVAPFDYRVEVGAAINPASGGSLPYVL